MSRLQPFRLAFFLSICLLSTGTVRGHEGHGHTPTGQGNSLWHYVSEPQHAWVFATVFCVSVAMVLFHQLQKRTQQS